MPPCCAVRHHTIERILALVTLAFVCAIGIGCSGALSSSHSQSERDPLHLGAAPGPLGTVTPQTVELRLGSEPNDRIVSLSLTADRLGAINSGNGTIDLLTAPVTFEFTTNAITSQPIFVGQIYQDTYSAIVFPEMTGQVVFYDSNGHLATQALSVAGQTVSLTQPFVLGATPQVLTLSLDLDNSFTVTDSSVSVNTIVLSSRNSAPDPAANQPETGSNSFLVGTVTAVDTVNQILTFQPSAGDAFALAYDNSGGTVFRNCDPTMLTGMMIETESVTETDGTILTSQIALVDNGATRSELFGALAGFAPDGFDYNLIVEGGAGANVSTSLLGKNVTVDWLNSSYAVNTTHLALSLTDNPDLVFDETHTFPGQAVQLSGDTLVVPDPDSGNAGLMQPSLFELEEQTIAGTVQDYSFDPETKTGTFTLNVSADAVIKRMNGGLQSIVVRQLPQTYLRSNPSFNNGDTVKVRGLLFAGCKVTGSGGECLEEYSNVNYNPAVTPVAFALIADRISR
jgi:hypothetical protein